MCSKGVNAVWGQNATDPKGTVHAGDQEGSGNPLSLA